MKKLSIILLVCFVILGLAACGKANNKYDTKDENQTIEGSAWIAFVDSLKKLNTQDKVTIYDMIGTFDTAHEEYHSKELDNKKIMEYLKGGYNYFLQKTIIENSNHQITYLSDYGSIGECTSKGNKFEYIKYVDDKESIFPKKESKEYELNFQNIHQFLEPKYNEMKQGKLYEEHKYIIKDGKATAYVEGRKKYEDKDIMSIESETSTTDYPPLCKMYAKGPLQDIIDRIEENNNFDANWLMVLSPAGRTTWGTEFPTKEMCSVEMKEENENIVITYKLDKNSNKYKAYIDDLKNRSNMMDLSWESLAYFDDANINIVIDKDGNLIKFESYNTMAYLNEGIEGFKVPQYAIIDLEYE